jgi:hypothetical protein
VVEELVSVSTGRPFEDTCSTSKAFAGEEVDWYVCNVGSFHIKQSMDQSVPVTENQDMERYLMLDDTVLFRQAALAIGKAELEELATHFAETSRWLEAAKVRWAVYYMSSSQTLTMMDEVVELLEKCGPTRTSGALQLELDVIGSLTYLVQKHTTGSAGRAQLGLRIAELGRNPSVRTDPWNAVFGSYPKVAMMVGNIPLAWDGGKRPPSVLKGMSMWSNQTTLLMQMACDSAVGARKVILA